MITGWSVSEMITGLVYPMGGGPLVLLIEGLLPLARTAREALKKRIIYDFEHFKK